MKTIIMEQTIHLMLKNSDSKKEENQIQNMIDSNLVKQTKDKINYLVIKQNEK